MKKKFQAAALQISPVFLDKKRSIEKYCDFIVQAGREGADLIVTPETGIPTYPYWRNNFGYTSPETVKPWKDTVVAYYENSVRIPDDIGPLCRAARSAKATCVIGCSEQDARPGSGTLYNTMIYISSSGEILGRHRKLMPTHTEKIFWGNGDASDLVVVETEMGRLGGLVCFENHVYWFKAAMAAQGEEIHAACWPGWWQYVGDDRTVRDMSGTPGPAHLCDQDSALREYAFSTQTFVISSSHILPEDQVPDDFPFKKTMNARWAIGGSCIVNPWGMYLVEPVLNRELILHAEIDMSERIVAKNIIDTMGHYARWDLITLNVRGNPWTPTGKQDSGPLLRAAGHMDEDNMASIAKKCDISMDKLAAVLEELKTLDSRSA
ncbi:MAG: carbon-nitrogen hydrolase family protein [Deltaproteobacteria bacterium]|nr:carbon-nitrogen hydrolase family protein [Deltaproteobacteria bacterium]MBW2308363.1 carbon-nitrogen hydrolase family protein [Deltaproteobacteria bacterium]